MVNLIRMKLVNFIGPYLGMGLKEFEIDRSRSKNNILLLVGMNGSGKSSIISEMTPLPLEHIGSRTGSRIICNVNGEPEIGIKELDYLVDNTVLYKIRIVYDPKKTTKCYIRRIIDGNEIELNPNGNVESYMEIIQRELHINKLFTNIGYLSKNIKNFVNMKPAERNNYISEWMPEIAEFLDAYKLSSKLLNKYKKEIDGYNKEIGNMSSINYELELKMVEATITNLTNQLNETDQKYIELKVYQNRLIKPNSSTYKELNDAKIEWFKRSNDHKKKLESITSYISDFEFLKDKSHEEIMDLCDKTKIDIMSKLDEINNIENNILLFQNDINSYKTMLSDDNKIRKADLNMILKNIDYNENLKKEIITGIRTTEQETFKNYRHDQLIMKNTQEINLIVQKLDFMFTNLNQLVSIDYIKDLNNIQELYDKKSEDRQKLMNLIIDIEAQIAKINGEIYKYENGNIDSTILMKRPNFCEGKGCGVIEELMKYLDPKENLNDLYSKGKELQAKLMEYKSNLEDINNNIKNLNDASKLHLEIVTYLHNNDNIIGNMPAPLYEIFSLENIYDIYIKLNEIKLIIKDLDELNSMYTKLDEIDKLLESFNNLKNSVIMNNQMQEKLNDTVMKYERQLKEKERAYAELETLKNNQYLYSNANEIMNKHEEEIDDFNRESAELEKMKNELLRKNTYTYIYNSNLHQLESYERMKLELQEKINEYNQKRDQMTTYYISKKQLEKLRNELQEEYNKTNILNKIWSPKVGYPSWKIESFLNDLTVQTNEDLAKMWGSSLRIEEFKIDSNDFLIKINNNGTIVKDASLLSDGQMSILMTAISLALIESRINQFGYDILRLDEVDGCLDYERRKGFLSMIQNRLEELGSDLCAIITHNDEFEDIPCDIIILKGSNIDESKLKNKNILYRYNE